MIIDKDHPVCFTSLIGDSICTIQVTHYLPAIQPKMYGGFEDAEEGSPAEFEYVAVCDGKSGAALISQISNEDDDRLFAEFEAFLLAKKHSIDF